MTAFQAVDGSSILPTRTNTEPISKTNDVARSARVVGLNPKSTLRLRGEANGRASSAPYRSSTLDFRNGTP